jgi:3-oxoacyl-ACP reductase-like protein
MSQQQAFDDASIPVLTEVVADTPPAHADAAAHDAAPAAVPSNPAPPMQATPATLEERAAATLSDEDWDALELRLCERIVHQLQGRVDFVLQQRVRDSISDVLQQALAGLTEEIRGGLEQTLEQIVTRAVSQELAHLKTLQR